MGSAHFQCWGLGFLCLSPLGMGFFLNTTGNGKFFLKRLGLGLRDILLMGMGLYFEWSSPVPLKILHEQRLEIRLFQITQLLDLLMCSLHDLQSVLRMCETNVSICV